MLAFVYTSSSRCKQRDVLRSTKWLRYLPSGYGFVYYGWSVYKSCALYVYVGRAQCWLDFPEQWQWRVYMTVIACAVFIIPALIIIICYAVIVCTIWSKSSTIVIINPQQRRKSTRGWYRRHVGFGFFGKQQETELTNWQYHVDRDCLSWKLKGLSRVNIQMIQIIFWNHHSRYRFSDIGSSNLVPSTANFNPFFINSMKHV